MCKEYIEREKLPKRKEYWDDDFGAGWDACLDAIDSIPAADVRPAVRGRWEYNPGDNIPYCSECMMPQDSECNFCPNCGADMRGEQDV